jgi:hypothetical protein
LVLKRRSSGSRTANRLAACRNFSKALPPELAAALVQFWGLGAVATPEFVTAVPGALVPAIWDVMPGEVVLTWACDVAEEKIQWDWYGLLARSKTTLLGGDPGCGKSTGRRQLS